MPILIKNLIHKFFVKKNILSWKNEINLNLASHFKLFIDKKNKSHFAIYVTNFKFL